jgi:hypothetical protein
MTKTITMLMSTLNVRQSSDVSGMTAGAVRWCIVRRPVQVVPRDPVRDAF